MSDGIEVSVILGSRRGTDPQNCLVESLDCLFRLPGVGRRGEAIRITELDGQVKDGKFSLSGTARTLLFRELEGRGQEGLCDQVIEAIEGSVQKQIGGV